MLTQCYLCKMLLNTGTAKNLTETLFDAKIYSTSDVIIDLCLHNAEKELPVLISILHK